MTTPGALAVRNLFAAAPAAGESLEALAGGDGFRLERIVSNGAPSPPGFWYDQEGPEWVALVAGSATLELRDAGEIELGAGDYLTIPARLEHRVARVSADAVWLAVHYRAAGTP